MSLAHFAICSAWAHSKGIKKVYSHPPNHTLSNSLYVTWAWAMFKTHELGSQGRWRCRKFVAKTTINMYPKKKKIPFTLVAISLKLHSHIAFNDKWCCFREPLNIQLQKIYVGHYEHMMSYSLLLHLNVVQKFFFLITNYKDI